MRNAGRIAISLLLAAALAAGVWYAFRQPPVLVDLVPVERGPMEVNVTEEGVARVRDVYTVSAPVAGQLERITLVEGDRVEAGATVVATIRPPAPPFLDERTRSEMEAEVEAARSAVTLARTELARAETALRLAQSQYDRATRLAQKDFVSESTLERTESDLRLQKAQVESAQANIRLREAELASAQARLTQPGSAAGRDRQGGCCVDIMAPVSGVVLAVLERSGKTVAQGTGLAQIGDPRRMEVAVDLLSRDAVRVKEGASVAIEDWGGEGALAGKVRRTEPAAFTKVSALGIEEQRVNAVIDLDAAPAGLGHNYRVLTRLQVWSANDVVHAPVGALFRAGGQWAVFAVENGKARETRVEIGRMNDRVAQILSGVEPGAQLVLFPNDQLSDGRRVERRPPGE